MSYRHLAGKQNRQPNRQPLSIRCHEQHATGNAEIRDANGKRWTEAVHLTDVLSPAMCRQIRITRPSESRDARKACLYATTWSYDHDLGRASLAARVAQRNGFFGRSVSLYILGKINAWQPVETFMGISASKEIEMHSSRP
jgi:hypothetical protein